MIRNIPAIIDSPSGISSAVVWCKCAGKLVCCFLGCGQYLAKCPVWLQLKQGPQTGGHCCRQNPGRVLFKAALPSCVNSKKIPGKRGEQVWSISQGASCTKKFRPNWPAWKLVQRLSFRLLSAHRILNKTRQYNCHGPVKSLKPVD